MLLTSCGKEEEKKGAIGAVAGATIGAVISSDKSKGEGTLLGALIGNYVGREIGRSKDKKKDKEKHNQEVNELKAQNRNLERQLEKWCQNCNRQVHIQSAKSCPSCGDCLIQEKFCDRCKTIYSPESGYKYCPYCSIKVALRSR
jgi:hypothetical protein